MTELMQRKGFEDYEAFRQSVMHETGVSFCTRLHFGRPQANERERYIRLAYSGIHLDRIKEGLGLFKQWAGA